MHAVAAAIDVRKIKDLAGGIYTSALACFVTASSSTLRGLSIGFDLAYLISRHIDHAFGANAERMHRLEVFRILPKETQKLARADRVPRLGHQGPVCRGKLGGNGLARWVPN